jgi:DNA (cytosine-5)-methyltransferase 1
VAKCLTTGVGQRYDPETETLIPTHGGVFDVAHAFKVRGGCDGGGKGYLGSDEVAFTISTHQDQHIFARSVIGFDGYNNDVTGDVTKTIDTGQDYHHVPIAFGWQNSSTQGDSCSDKITPTLDKSKTPAIMKESAVRRLTPRECERLQGFPDDYTLTPHRGKPMADGPRYKALGNSMAVPVMHWIGKRIQMVEDLKEGNI